MLGIKYRITQFGNKHDDLNDLFNRHIEKFIIVRCLLNKRFSLFLFIMLYFISLMIIPAILLAETTTSLESVNSLDATLFDNDEEDAVNNTSDDSGGMDAETNDSENEESSRASNPSDSETPSSGEDRNSSRSGSTEIPENNDSRSRSTESNQSIRNTDADSRSSNQQTQPSRHSSNQTPTTTKNEPENTTLEDEFSDDLFDDFGDESEASETASENQQSPDQQTKVIEDEPYSPTMYRLADILLRLGIGGISPSDAVYRETFGLSMALNFDVASLFTQFGHAYFTVKYYRQSNDESIQSPVMVNGEPVDYMIYNANIRRTTFQASLGWRLMQDVAQIQKKSLNVNFSVYLGIGMTFSFVQDNYNVILDDYLNQTSTPVQRDSDPFIPFGFEGMLGLETEIWQGLGAFIEATYGVNGAGKYRTNFDGFSFRTGISYCFHSRKKHN